MADRVAVFNHGRLEQFGPPSEIYDRPATLFVNTFVGAANVLAGVVARSEGENVKIALDGGGGEVAGRSMQGELAAGTRVFVCIRPEHIRRAPEGLPGTIEMSLPLGASVVHEVRLANGSSVKLSESRAAGAPAIPAGSPVSVAPSSPQLVNIFRQN